MATLSRSGAIEGVSFQTWLWQPMQRSVGGTPATALPSPVGLATIPAGADLGQEGVTPLVVPNDGFYEYQPLAWQIGGRVIVLQEVVEGLIDLGLLLLLAAGIAALVVYDGESTWEEGSILIGLYVVIAASFWWGA